MDIKDRKRLVALELDQLLRMEPTAHEDLAAWYRRSQDVRRLLEEANAHFPVPHEIWHYIDDADIRFKDKRYAELQLPHVISQVDEWLGRKSVD